MARLEFVRQDDKVTVLKGMATVFGSPERLDLSGEFFDAETWFGDNLIREKFAIYDHAINDQQNPYSAAGAPPDPILGVAKFIEADARGRWFEFEIDRANEYHDFVMALHAMNRLGTSSRTLPGAGVKMMDPQIKGRIAKWPEVEVTLTPTPCDDATAFTEEDVMAVVGAMKTYAPKLHEQWQAALVKNAQEAASAAEVAEVPETPVVVDPLQAAVDDLLSEVPNEIPEIDAPAEDIKELLPDPMVVELQATIAAMEARLKAQEEELVGVKALMATVESLQKHLTTVVNETKTLKTDMSLLKTGKVAKWLEGKSALELAAYGVTLPTKQYTPPASEFNHYTPQVAKSVFGPEAPGS